MIIIINYGAGNLASVQNACACLKYPTRVVNNVDEIHALEKNVNTASSAPNSNSPSTVILPGVGDGSYMMSELSKRGLTSWLQNWAQADKPLLGICVGAQVLLSSTEEGGAECLGLIEGACKSFLSNFDEAQTATLKIPHMGWNDIHFDEETPLFRGIPAEASVYFVHSYYLSVADSSNTLATTNYGIDFSAIIGKGKVVGTQFHPEKSGKWGMKIIDNYLRYYAGECSTKEQVLDTQVAGKVQSC